MVALLALLPLVTVPASSWSDEPSPPAAPPVSVIEESADAEFNLELPITFAGDNAAATVVTRLDEQANGDRLELRLKHDGLVFVRVQGGKEQPLGSVALKPAATGGQGPVLVTLRRRDEKADVLVGNHAVLTAWQEAATGKLSLVAPAGVVDRDRLLYQPYAPPDLSDDFMRSETDSTGDWQVLSGKWENTALVDNLRFVPRAANSFAFAAHPASPALAAAGNDFWDDYQCAVSVRAPAPGTAGLAFRVQDAANYYLFSADFGSPEASGRALLKLTRVVGGNATVLAQQPRPIPTGQWYRLAAVVSGSRIETTFDDAPIFSATDDTFAEGQIGLFAAHCETIYFDDVDAHERKDFTDDFAQTGASRWQTVQGEWQVIPPGKSGGAVLAKKTDSAALAVTGRATWTDYRYEVRVKPSGGAWGVCFYWRSPTDTWLWRYRSGKQQLVEVAGGKERVADESPLDLSAKDAWQVVVRAGKDYASVAVNGSRPLEAILPGGLAGKVGLWADRGSRPLISEVRVTFPPGYVPAKLPATMVTDVEMKEQFANPAEGWFQVGSESAQPEKVGMNWNKGEYFPPVDVSFPLTGVGTAAGKVTLTLEGDQTAPGGGYDLVLTAQAQSPKLHLELVHGGQVVAQGDAQVDTASGTCQVRAARRGSFLVAYVDETLALSYRQGHTPPAADQSAK